MSLPTGRRRLLAAIALLVASWVVVAPARHALAHAVLLETTPAAGALLDRPPGTVGVTFDEPVEWGPSSLLVIDESGTTISEPPTSNGSTLSAAVPDDGSGWFAVSWSVVSADGHPLSGAWTYRVGAGADAAPEDLLDRAGSATEVDAGARWAWTIAQWASALTAVVLLGTSFVALVTGVSVPLRRLALLGGVAAVTAALVAAGTNGPHIGPQVGWFDGPASDELLTRAALLAFATAAIATTARRDAPTRAIALGATALAAAGTAAAVWSGHAAAEGGAAVAAVGAHLVVAGCWLGAVPAVLVAVRAEPAEAAQILRLFSRAATWLLAATVVAGVGAAAILSGGPGSVAQDWGVILVAKVAFVVMAALAGAWTRFNVVPHIGSLRPADVHAPLLFEVAALVAVVTASVALTHNGPPREVDAAAVEATTDDESIVVGAEDEEVSVTVVVDPGRVGTNDVHVFVVDPVGLSVDVEEVVVTLASEELGIGEITVPLSELGAGHYSARIDDLGLAGTWELRAVVRPTPFTQLEIVEPIEVTDPER